MLQLSPVHIVLQFETLLRAKLLHIQLGLYIWTPLPQVLLV